ARTRLYRDDVLIAPARRQVLEPGYAGQEIKLRLSQGRPLRIEKTAVLYSSRDAAISEPARAARKAIARAPGFEAASAASALAWDNLWGRFDVELTPARDIGIDVQMLLRLNMFHLLQAASLNSIGLDVGVPARAWTGEAYQGHIFWDELFIFPTLT